MVKWWILLGISVITLWLLSLWRILFSYSSFKQVNPSFPSKSNKFGNGRRKRNVMLVMAHPDDESMFFAPTILYLTSHGHNIHILCLSNGNAEGKGYIRKEELYHACAILKVSRKRVKVVDHHDLQDGFDNPWKHHLIATIVEDEIEKQIIDTLITFDGYGVSGHPNHRDVHNGICMILHGNVDINIEAWELVSTNIFRKYAGPIDVWISMLSSSDESGNICLSNPHPLQCYQSMAQHYSQWIWFRKIYVLLSRYTYINTIRRIIY